MTGRFSPRSTGQSRVAELISGATFRRLSGISRGSRQPASHGAAAVTVMIKAMIRAMIKPMTQKASAVTLEKIGKAIYLLLSSFNARHGEVIVVWSTAA